ncbi:MAG: hypothetical protein ACI9VR_004025 [Cognaticolwellia sp.]|jgi:hypothetical protein
MALGCTPLLPEHVLAVPGEMAAESLDGTAGFGARLAWVQGELAVAGDGAVHWGGESWVVDQVLAMWAGPEGPRIASPNGVWDLSQDRQLFSGPVVAAHGDGERFVVASQGELIQGDQSRTVSGIGRVRMDGERVLLLRCSDQRCWVEIYEEGLDALELGPAGPSSALVFSKGNPVWGEPKKSEKLAKGAIRDSAGILQQGLEGEHLGQAICGDFAAGEHNLRTMPNQSRVRSLSGGLELAFESGREGAAMTLACDDSYLAVGQPTWLEGGRVWVFELPLGR